MPDIVVRPVSSRGDRKQFLELPWKLYRDDPNWVPPLRGDQKELVGYKPHPFYEEAEGQTFLAVRGGEVCGRIAAVLNRRHNAVHHENRGFWGFFECVDDQAVAGALFDAVTGWFAERGIHDLRGPMNPSLNHTLGLLIEGFDSPPTFMMTYNPLYYPKLVEGCGFRKSQDLYAYWGNLDHLDRVVSRYRHVYDQVIERFELKVRRLDRSRFLEDVRQFLALYNESLKDTWGFVPLSEKEIEHTAKGLRYLLVPDLTTIVEVEGKPVGAAFGLLDYNPRIKAIDGRLFPFGFLRLLLGRKGITKIRILAANVLPEYQRLGVGMVAVGAMAPLASEFGIREAEFSWILESNMLSRGSLEKGGAEPVKTYRIYDRDRGPEESSSS